MARTPSQTTVRVRLETRYQIARFSVLVMLALILINLLMRLAQENGYSLLYYNGVTFVLDIGMYFGGIYNIDPVTNPGLGMFGPSFFFIMLAVVVVLVTAYFVCWLLSAKGRYGFLIAAVSMLGADLLSIFLKVLIGIIPANEVDFVFAVDVIVYAVVIYLIIDGLIAHKRLAALNAQDAPIYEEREN